MRVLRNRCESNMNFFKYLLWYNYFIGNLIVKDVEKTDAGEYICQVQKKLKRKFFLNALKNTRLNELKFKF